MAFTTSLAYGQSAQRQSSYRPDTPANQPRPPTGSSKSLSPPRSHTPRAPLDPPKMRELVTLQVGQAGNQVATSFWERILAEHGLDEDGHIKPNVDHVCTDRLDVFFSEAGGSAAPDR